MGKVTEATTSIKGKSGTTYSFEIYTTDTSFKKVGAIYVFTARTKGNNGNFNHTLIYCGKTDDLSTRFADHHKMDCIKKNNTNCICVKTVNTEKERMEIETDILKGNNFKCNDVLN